MSRTPLLHKGRLIRSDDRTSKALEIKVETVALFCSKWDLLCQRRSLSSLLVVRWALVIILSANVQLLHVHTWRTVEGFKFMCGQISRVFTLSRARFLDEQEDVVRRLTKRVQAITGLSTVYKKALSHSEPLKVCLHRHDCVLFII